MLRVKSRDGSSPYTSGGRYLFSRFARVKKKEDVLGLSSRKRSHVNKIFVVGDKSN